MNVPDVRIEIVTSHNIPEGKMFSLRGEPRWYMHPNDYLRCKIQTEPGLSYAQRSTMLGRIVYDERRSRRKPTPRATYKQLLELGRRVPGVPS
jgi:hypothetical protein